MAECCAVRIVLQAISAAYAPLKDMYSSMKDKKKDVEKLDDNYSKMTVEFGIFSSTKQNIDRRLEKATSREKNGAYDLLIDRSEKIKKEYDNIVNKYKELRPSSQSNDVPSATKATGVVHEGKPTVLTTKFFKLARLSKKIEELVHEISSIEDRMKLENMSCVRNTEPVQLKYDDDDIDLPSFTEYVSEILRCLSEYENWSVGILGPIGVGKTTIMKGLNNQLEHSKYDLVFFIDDCNKQQGEDDGVDGTAKVIQDVIIGRLSLEVEKANTIDQNADTISRLLSDKKYILLIDQVSSTINLDRVGIHKNRHKFGKVVVASSSTKVITLMTDAKVEIRPLSDKDAFRLLQKRCGEIRDTRIKTHAKGIVRSCGGLPLVIKLVATHLQGKDEDVWSDMKRYLQSETKDRLRTLDGVGHAYKLVFDTLETNAKKCLLFVTLFPSDHKIYKDYLIECWNAERFLELDVQQLRTARERAATILGEITDQYLLESHSKKHVKMPEYFRKVAVQQEYPGETDSLSWVPQENQQLTQETWETNKRISLIGDKSKLPGNPRNDKISTLLMQCNCLLVLEDLFFQNLQKLLILDLHRTMIQSLPNSITSLVSLRCLYVNDCHELEELPPQVEKLENLEVLDIRGTKILSLPSKMGELSQLRCLRISFGRKGCNRNETSEEVMVIPPDMICRLHQLEELTIEAGCCSKAWNDIVENIVSELASLEKLSTLNFHFPGVSSLKKFVTKSKSLKNTGTHWSTNTLRSFDMSVGCCEIQFPNDLHVSRLLPERRFRFYTNGKKELVEEVLRQTSSFELIGHYGVESLSDFDLINAGTLQVCVVGSCNNMSSLVYGSKINKTGKEITEETDGATLQCLEKLHLFDLQMLKYIWTGPVSSGSLAYLKYLTLSACPELTTILNHELARALSSLEYVKVESCSKVAQIINEENPDEDNSGMLDKVKTIDLIGLPMLQKICKTGSLNWKSLETIAVRSCIMLGDIHVSLRNAEKLARIECEESWWDQLPKEQNKKNHPRCHFIVVEPKATISEEESSDPVASKVTVSNKGKEKLEYTNNLVVSNSNHGYQDMPESSHGVDHATHQPTNKNAPEICPIVEISTTEIN